MYYEAKPVSSLPWLLQEQQQLEGEKSFTTGCLAMSVKSEPPLFSDICWRGDQAWRWIRFFEENFLFCQGQGQVQAQSGFHAQPSLQQVHDLCGYSTFWPENHFTWYTRPKKFIFGVRFKMWSGNQAKKLNTSGQHELELAANWAEPENQAERVPGPDPEEIKNSKFFFSKNLIHLNARSSRKRTACCVNVCPRKGVSHFLHLSRDTL